MSATPTREQVARTIVRAATIEELEDARILRETYLAENPDDDDIQAMGDLLDVLATTLKPKDNHDGVTDSKK